MNFLEQAIRMANTSEGVECYPYYFAHNEGHEWTDEEKQAIDKVMAGRVPEVVTPMYNNWIFTKSVWGDDVWYVGRKATWDRGFYRVDTIEELAAKVDEYYKSWGE